MFLIDVVRLIVEVYLYGAAVQHNLNCVPCAAVVLEEVSEVLGSAYLLIQGVLIYSIEVYIGVIIISFHYRRVTVAVAIHPEIQAYPVIRIISELELRLYGTVLDRLVVQHGYMVVIVYQ